MSFNGSGVFVVNSAGQPVVATTLIEASVFNAFSADVATGLSTCVTKDGQTVITANLPMAGFKFTGLAAGSAAGNSVRYEQLLTFAADVAAHATTANPWVAREVTLTGGAVTFTDIADAPAAGATVWVKQNAAHVWTNGAVFSVQGGASYTAAAGDWIRIYATTVSTFEVTIFSALGDIGVATQAQQETGTATNLAVTPGRQQFHPSAAKAWCMATIAGGMSASYNMTSVTDTGVGDITFTIGTDFSSVDWVPQLGIRLVLAGGAPVVDAYVGIQNATFGAGSFNGRTIKISDGTAVDPSCWNFVGYGDQ